MIAVLRAFDKEASLILGCRTLRKFDLGGSVDSEIPWEDVAKVVGLKRHLDQEELAAEYYHRSKYLRGDQGIQQGYPKKREGDSTYLLSTTIVNDHHPSDIVAALVLAIEYRNR